MCVQAIDNCNHLLYEVVVVATTKSERQEMPDIVQLLQKLGFGDYEARAYVTLVQRTRRVHVPFDYHGMCLTLLGVLTSRSRIQQRVRTVEIREEEEVRM